MPGPPQRTHAFSSSYPASDRSIAHARQEVTDWLRSHVADDGDVVDELAVVVSELVTNAIRATDGSRDTVTVAVRIEGGAILLEVCNPSATWVDVDRRWDLDDPLRLGGRGLLIVRSLVDDVTVEVDPDAVTTSVRCRRELGHLA
jgi:anti-sigma regulatory factor (Ser/Thr protein kinase)